MNLAALLKTKMVRAAVLSSMISAALGAIVVGIHWASTFGPRWWQIAGVEILFLPTMLAVLLIPAFVVLLVFRSARGVALCTIVGLVVFTAGQLVAWRLADRVRIRGFCHLANEARPLVAAIRDYEIKHGVPPPALEAIPPKVRAGLPNFQYRADKSTPELYDGNRWVLFLPANTGVLNFDQFIYYPRQNYPDRGHGGWLQPVADWAYVHE